MKKLIISNYLGIIIFLTFHLNGICQTNPDSQDQKIKSMVEELYSALGKNETFSMYYNSFETKFKLRDYESALADLNKAIEVEKDFAEAYFNRGLTKIYLDDIEGGAMDLSKAGELGIQDAYNIIKRYCN